MERNCFTMHRLHCIAADKANERYEDRKRGNHDEKMNIHRWIILEETHCTSKWK